MGFEPAQRRCFVGQMPAGPGAAIDAYGDRVPAQSVDGGEAVFIGNVVAQEYR
ncbi:hypothetical protein D3C83_164420 [compost metagenome]